MFIYFVCLYYGYHRSSSDNTYTFKPSVSFDGNCYDPLCCLRGYVFLISLSSDHVEQFSVDVDAAWVSILDLLHVSVHIVWPGPDTITLVQRAMCYEYYHSQAILHNTQFSFGHVCLSIVICRLFSRHHIRCRPLYRSINANLQLLVNWMYLVGDYILWVDDIV